MYDFKCPDDKPIILCVIPLIIPLEMEITRIKGIILNPIQIIAPIMLFLAEDLFSVFGKIKLFAKKIDEYNFIAVYLPQFSIVHHHFLQDLNHE